MPRSFKLLDIIIGFIPGASMGIGTNQSPTYILVMGLCTLVTYKTIWSAHQKDIEVARQEGRDEAEEKAHLLEADEVEVYSQADLEYQAGLLEAEHRVTQKA